MVKAMRYCKRCVYPANTRPSISFDDQGVCGGCRAFEARDEIDWEEGKQALASLLDEFKEKAKAQEAPYDCIIPVSGGKDSHYQTHLIKNVFGLDPLLVTYNHAFNTKLGLRNLRNLVEKFGCDLLRFTSNRETIRKITKYMLPKVGDVTWHYHAGIMTFPIRAAVMYKTPLIIWGESGYRYKMGMWEQGETVEFSREVRREHDMRGLEPEDILNDEEAQKLGITKTDLAPFEYPSDSEIKEVGVRGIYLDNFLNWDSHKQAKQMIEGYDFGTHPPGVHQSGRTFLNYSETDDAANGTHDYLSFLKFGYGRATHHASREIRHGRMTREEAIELVMKYDHLKPPDFGFFLSFLDMTEQEFLDSIEHLRDPEIWEKDSNGEWHRTDTIANHIDDPGIDEARLSTTDEHYTDISSPVTDFKDEDMIIL